LHVLLIALFMIPLVLGCKTGPDKTGPENTGICGTWPDVVVDFEAVVWNHQLDEPVEGAELSCDGEVRATSDEEGVIAFTLETTESTGGCGYTDCNTVTIEAPSDALQPVTMDLDEANGSTIELMYGAD
jgi:hypothetical protein